jgi:hypothetical protein
MVEFRRTQGGGFDVLVNGARVGGIDRSGFFTHAASPTREFVRIEADELEQIAAKVREAGSGV